MTLDRKLRIKTIVKYTRTFIQLQVDMETYVMMSGMDQAQKQLKEVLSV